jgi:hypothetical protein
VSSLPLLLLLLLPKLSLLQSHLSALPSWAYHQHCRHHHQQQQHRMA